MKQDDEKSEQRPREHYFLLVGAFIVLAGVVTLGWVIDPDPRGFGTHERLGLPECQSIKLFGFPCPGCGVTTSVSNFWHGNFQTSFVKQPFGFLLAMLVPSVALGAIVSHFRGRDLYAYSVSVRWGRWFLGLGVAMLGAWVYTLLQP